MDKTLEENIKIHQTESLYASITRLITSSQDSNAVLEKIMQEITHYFKPANWSLLRLDDIKRELYFVICHGLDQKLLKDVRIPLDKGIVGRVARTKKMSLVIDAQNSDDFYPEIDKITGFITKSVVAVPIVHNERVLGVIALFNCEDGSKFSERDAFILQTIADFSAVAIVNTELYEKILTMTYFDPLTGAYNRAKFSELEKGWTNKQNQRKGEATCISMIDLNDFKLINDSLGHLAGDQVLRDMAICFNGVIRDHDYLFRMGGDEFLMVLTHLDKKQSKAAEKRLIENLSELQNQENLPCAFSFGTANGYLKDINILIEKADKVMYSNKQKK